MNLRKDALVLILLGAASMLLLFALVAWRSEAVLRVAADPYWLAGLGILVAGIVGANAK